MQARSVDYGGVEEYLSMRGMDICNGVWFPPGNVANGKTLPCYG